MRGCYQSVRSEASRWSPAVKNTGWSRQHTMPRGETREVHGDWVIAPAFRSESDTRPFRTRAYFVDQLDNAHIG